MKNMLVFSIFIFFAAFVQADAEMTEQMKLLRMMDQMDNLDFQDTIKAADKCTRARQFRCASDNLKKARRYVNTSQQRRQLDNSKRYLANEREAKNNEDYQREQQRREAIARMQREQAEEDRRRRQEASSSSSNSNALMAGLYHGLKEQQNSMPSVDETFRQHNVEMRRITQQKQREQEQYQRQQKQQQLESTQRRYEQQAQQRAREQELRFAQEQQRKQVTQLNRQVGGSSSPSYTSASASIVSSKSAANKSQCEPVDEQGVRIPSGNIPDNLLCRRYSPVLSIEWTQADINKLGLFNVETGSASGAEREVKTYLKNKARKACKARGFGSSVSLYGRNYEIGELIEWRAMHCDSRVLMGSEFHHCLGSAGYRCGESQ